MCGALAFRSTFNVQHGMAWQTLEEEISSFNCSKGDGSYRHFFPRMMSPRSAENLRSSRAGSQGTSSQKGPLHRQRSGVNVTGAEGITIDIGGIDYDGLLPRGSPRGLGGGNARFQAMNVSIILDRSAQDRFMGREWYTQQGLCTEMTVEGSEHGDVRLGYALLSYTFN